MRIPVKIALLFLFLFPLISLVVFHTSINNSFDVHAQAAYDLDGEAATLNYCPPELEWCYNVASEPPPCGGDQTSCDGVIGNTEGEYYEDPVTGSWVFGPVFGDGEDDGGGGIPQIIIPTPITPPTEPNQIGTIRGYAISGPTQYLDTCAELSAIKTCLDNLASPLCATVPGAKSFVPSTVFYLNGSYANTQTDATGVIYTNLPANYLYSISVTHPSNSYSVYSTCNSSSFTPATWTLGGSTYVEQNETVTYLVGLGPVLPWLKIHNGGNSYANAIYSLMPLAITPTLQFDSTYLPSTSPGIVSMGFDFSDSFTATGKNNISSTNWNTNNAVTAKDWYAYFSGRLSQAAQTTYTGFGVKPAQIAGQTFSVYKTTDDLLINTPWTIADTEKLIIIVNGELDIRARVNITGNGFVAFIVKDNILIDSAVGTAWNTSTPVVEGMYIAGDTIKTGVSNNIATERFIGKGMFIANTILTQRNLITAGKNNYVSADLFIYNPGFLITMPDILKDLSYTWQEVAP